jgi:arginine repressor
MGIKLFYYNSMFIRLKRSGNQAHPHDYLQIVESYRIERSVRQRVIATLGRLDQLRAEGQLDGLIKSLCRFSETLRVMEASRAPAIDSCSTKLWGPALVFGRLWERQGIPGILEDLAGGRRLEFDLERVGFALSLQRLVEPGSDLQGSRWVRTVEAPGLEKIELQHLYRGVGVLSDLRESLEKRLYFQDRDLFNRTMDLVFVDTTSTYMYRDRETPLWKRGHSRDHRPDLPQVILAIVVDRQGWPIAWEVMPGNRADGKAFQELIGLLRRRFQIGRVIVVADRGMVSEKNLEMLTQDGESPLEYIVGCRMRKQREVAEEVLSRGGRYQEVSQKLKVKEVEVKGHRYVVCLNEEEAKKDKATRESMVKALEDKLAKGGPKSLVGNRGYARFLKTRRGAVEVDYEAVKKDERLDGKFVLRTTTKLSAKEVAQAYKGLWRVERTFREQKSTLEVRPIYHQKDTQCVGHIMASFLALRLEVDLQRALDERGVEVPWPDLMGDLRQLQAVRITMDGKKYLIRTDLAGNAHQAFLAAGVKIPPRVQPIGMA